MKTKKAWIALAIAGGTWFLMFLSRIPSWAEDGYPIGVAGFA
jgi:hypothetical protein